MAKHTLRKRDFLQGDDQHHTTKMINNFSNNDINNISMVTGAESSSVKTYEYDNESLQTRLTQAHETLSSLSQTSKSLFLDKYSKLHVTSLTEIATDGMSDIALYLDRIQKFRPDLDTRKFKNILRDVLGALAHLELVYKNNDVSTWCRTLVYVVAVLSDYDLGTITQFMQSSITDLVKSKFENEAAGDEKEWASFTEFIKGGKVVFNSFSPTGLIGKMVEFVTRCTLLCTGLCKTYDDLRNFDLSAVSEFVYEKGSEAISLCEVIGSACVFISENFHKLFKGDLSWLEFTVEDFQQLENKAGIIKDITRRLEKFGELKALKDTPFDTVYELKDEAAQVIASYEKKIEREKNQTTRIHLSRFLDQVRDNKRTIDHYLDDAGVFVQPAGAYFVGPPGTGKTYAVNEVAMKLNATWTGERKRDKTIALKLTDKYEDAFTPDTRIVTVDEVGTRPRDEDYTRIIKLINATEELVDHSNADLKAKITMRHKVTMFTSNYGLGFLRDKSVTHKVSEGAPLRRLDVVVAAIPTAEASIEAGSPFSIDHCVDDKGQVRDDALEWYIGNAEKLISTAELPELGLNVVIEDSNRQWTMYANDTHFCFVNNERYDYHVLCQFKEGTKKIKSSQKAHTKITTFLNESYARREQIARKKIMEEKQDVCRRCGNYASRCECSSIDMENEALMQESLLTIYRAYTDLRNRSLDRISFLTLLSKLKTQFQSLWPFMLMGTFIMTLSLMFIKLNYIESAPMLSVEFWINACATFWMAIILSISTIISSLVWLMHYRVQRMDSAAYLRYYLRPVVDQVYAYRGSIVFCAMTFLAAPLVSNFLQRNYTNEYIFNPHVTKEEVLKDCEEKQAHRVPQTGRDVNDPYYVRVNTQVSKESTTTPPEQILTLIKKHLVRFTLNGTEVGFALPTSQGYLVRKHYFNGCNDIVDIGVSGVGLNRSVRPNYGLSLNRVLTTLPDSDYALISSAGLGSLPSLEKYFPGDNKSWNRGMVIHLNPDSMDVNAFNPTTCSVRTVNAKIPKNDATKAYEGRLSNNTFNGMCGLPIIDACEGVIRGVHMAGQTNKGGLFLAEPIDKELFNQLVNKSKCYQPAPYSPPLLTGEGIVSNEPKLISQDCSDPKLNINPKDLTLRYEGSISSGAALNRAGFRHNRYYDQVVAVYGPAPTENPYAMNDIKHRKKHIQKVSDRKDLDDYELMRKCKINYFKSIMDHIKSLSSKDKLNRSQYLSLDQALNGLPGDLMGSIDPRTAAGHPWGGKKNAYLVKDSEGELVRPLRLIPEYEEQVLEKFRMIVEEGKTLGTVFNASIKSDETLPPEKKKARVFSAGPFLDFILARMVLGNLLIYYRTFPEVCETGLGLDMNSAQGKRLFEFLKPEEGWPASNHCFDYSSFDTSNSASLSSETDEGFLLLLKALGCDESHLRAANSLLTSWSYPYYNHAGDILQCASSNPSGNFFTTLKNGAHNSIYIRYAFYKLNPHLDPETHDFRAVVRLVTFGDDNAMRVHPDFHLSFTGPKIVKVLAKSGIVLTSADKCSDVREFVPYEDLNFLSQSPIYHDVLGWIPTMDERSLVKSLYHVKVGCKQDFEQLLDNALWKLENTVSKGRDVYNEQYQKLTILFKSIDTRTVVLPTYEDALDTIHPKYLPTHISNVDRARAMNWDIPEQVVEEAPSIRDLSNALAEDFINQGKCKKQLQKMSYLNMGIKAVLAIAAYTYIISWVMKEATRDSRDQIPAIVIKRCKEFLVSLMENSEFWMKVAKHGYNQGGFTEAIKELIRAQEELPLYMYDDALTEEVVQYENESNQPEYTNESIPFVHPLVFGYARKAGTIFYSFLQLLIIITVFETLFAAYQKVILVVYNLTSMFQTGAFCSIQTLLLRGQRLEAIAPAAFAGRLKDIKLDGIVSIRGYKHALSKVISQLAARSHVAGRDKIAVDRMLSNLTKIDVKCKLVNFDGSLKRQAFGVLIKGPPGSGKSALTAKIYQRCFARIGVNIRKDEVVVLNEEDDFDSEFRSDHRVVVLDDRGAVHHDLKGTCPWEGVLRYCNNVPQSALNPNLESKGIINIKPDIFFVTTNRKLLGSDGIKNADGFIVMSALARRFLAVIEMELDHSWVLHRFSHLHIGSNQTANYECVPNYTYIPGETEEERINKIADMFKQHIEEQDKFINSINGQFCDSDSDIEYENESFQVAFNISTFLATVAALSISQSWLTVIKEMINKPKPQVEAEEQYENESVPLEEYMAHKEYRDMILSGEFDQLPKPPTWMSLFTDFFFWLIPVRRQEPNKFENEGLSTTINDTRYTYPADSPISHRYLRSNEFNLTHTHLNQICNFSFRYRGELYYIIEGLDMSGYNYAAPFNGHAARHIYAFQDVCDADPHGWIDKYGLKGLRLPQGYDLSFLMEH